MEDHFIAEQINEVYGVYDRDMEGYKAITMLLEAGWLYNYAQEEKSHGPLQK